MAINEALQFRDLLNCLTSADNSLRTSAEQTLAQLRSTQPDFLVSSLVEAISLSHPSTTLRAFAAVMLRREFTREAGAMLEVLQQSTRVAAKGSLLAHLQAEHEEDIRHKLCDTIGELAALTLDEEDWPELLPFLATLIRSNEPAKCQSALFIFGSIAEHIANQEQTLGELIQILKSFLASENQLAELKLSAIKTLGALLFNTTRSETDELIQAVLPELMNAISFFLSQENLRQACSCLEVLIDVASAKADFFRPQLQLILSGMLQTVANHQVAVSIRQLSMEMLISLCECAPAMVRKCCSPRPGFADSIVQVAMGMLLELPETTGWAESEEEVEMDEGENGEILNYHVGLDALDRLGASLGGRLILPPTFDLINDFLQRAAQNPEEWRYPHAALMAVAQVMDSAIGVKAAPEYRAEAVKCCITFFAHPNARVRYAAFQAVGLICVGHAPDFQTEHWETIFPNLIQQLDASANPFPRPRAHAAAALSSFLDECPGELAKPYLDQIMNGGLHLLTNGPRLVQQQALNILASTAECAQEDFGRYYTVAMPLLRKIFSECPSTSEWGEFRGKSLECISLIGVAVGKEVFGAEALEVMQEMVQTQSGKLADDDPQRHYILKAWARISKCLGSDFTPYLPLVMPSVLQAANLEVQVPLVEDNDDDSDIETYQVEDGHIAVRTSFLEEQATAIQMLLLLAESLKETFFPYVEQTIQVLGIHMTTSVHDDIRSYCIACFPELVRVTGIGMKDDLSHQGVKHLMEFTLEKLVEALQIEPELELLMTILQAMKLTILYAATPWEAVPVEEDSVDLDPQISRRLLSAEQMDALTEALVKCFAESFQRRAVQTAEAQVSQDYDEEEKTSYLLKMADEVELQFNIAEVIASLLKTHGGSFMKSFTTFLLPRLLEMSSPQCMASDKKVAMYILDDMLEYGSPAATDHVNQVLPVMMKGCESFDDPTLLQASAFGISLAASQYTEAFSPFVQPSLTALFSIINLPDESNKLAAVKDNALSAVGSICEHHKGFPNENQAWEKWLSSLPLTHDEEESSKNIIRLCRLIDAQDQRLLGQQLSNMPAALTVLAKAVESSLENEAMATAILGTLAGLQQKGCQDMLLQIGESDRNKLAEFHEAFISAQQSS